MSTSRPVRHRLATMALALSLLAAACGGSDDTASPDTTVSASSPTTEAMVDDTPQTTSAPETTAAPTTTEAAAPPLELIAPGEYAVGVATIEVNDASRERPLTVDVWFPLAEDATGDPQQYTLTPGVYYESPDAFAGSAESISANGPFPLVMYSHGSGGLRYLHSTYTEAIASHGYIVMAPDHTGNTAVNRLADNSDETDVIAANRPLDISAVIDAALDPAHPTAGGFAANIDGENIAVTGHSFGGYTSYALASGVTIGDVEVEPDTRIDALIALAPATGEQLLTDERLASIAIPSMIIVGTDDKTTPIESNVERPWDLSPASPHYRVELVAAEHQTFTDLCQYQDFLPNLDAVPEIIIETIDTMGAEGCSAGDMPIERAIELTNTLAINFLDEVLGGGPGFDPASVELPDDITIEAK